jgi:hypothetical protein
VTGAAAPIAAVVAASRCWAPPALFTCDGRGAREFYGRGRISFIERDRDVTNVELGEQRAGHVVQLAQNMPVHEVGNRVQQVFMHGDPSGSERNSLHHQKRALYTDRGLAASSVVGQSVDRAGRGGVGELPNGIGDPAPDGHAVIIAGRRKLVGARCAFLKRSVAVTLEHQGGGAPDVDLGITPQNFHELTGDCKTAQPHRNSGPSRTV